MAKIRINANEIFWELLNCFIAGGISFLSSITVVNEINIKVFLIAGASAGLVFLIKFGKYVETEKSETERKPVKLLSFI